MKRTILVATVVGVVALVATAAAQMLPFAKAPAWKVREVAEEVGVPSGTIEDFLDERGELRKQLLRTKGEMALARLELEEVFEAEEVDAKEAEAKHEKLLDLEQQLRRDMLSLRIAVRRTFSHEQLEEIREMMPPRGHGCRPGERGSRHGMGHERGHRFGHWEGNGPPGDDFLGDG